MLSDEARFAMHVAARLQAAMPSAHEAALRWFVRNVLEERRRMRRGRRCEDCGARTRLDTCPGCGMVVCQLCAEREGSFCRCADGKDEAR